MQENLTVNCEICDTRKIREENYGHYNQIILNAYILLVSESSKRILSGLPITINVERTLEIPDDVSFHFVNGDFELNENTFSETNTFLFVDGTLSLQSGSEGLLSSFGEVYVTGDVRIPESMEAFPGKLHADGSLIQIPDHCRELEDVFVMDKYFPIRAARNGKYYAKDQIKITDPDIDLDSLADKGVSFVTRSVLAREDMLPSLFGMFDETVKFQVIPSDYACLDGDIRLNEALLAQYGSRLYIDGNLFLNEAEAALLSRLEAVKVSGDIFLTSQQKELLKDLVLSCRSLILTKEKILENLPHVTVDSEMLSLPSGGVEIKNSAYIELQESVSPELILEKLSIRNCACVICSPLQASAVRMVGKNIAAVRDGDEANRGADHPILEMLRKMESSKMVNAERYEM